MEFEEDVFEVVVKWVEVDEDMCLCYMDVLLWCVWLENISVEFLDNL